MFDNPEFFDTLGMKMESMFYELSYWEHINISHLLDPMHIFKSVSYYLWRHISSKKVTHWVL